MPEFGAFLATVPAMMPFMPRGTGQPVLVLPGFMADDTSTAPIRWFLNKLGYPTYGWKVGRNVGPTDHVIASMTERIDELVERHEEPISMVGWSLGGVFAREIARLAPDHIREVITLGSPFQMERPGDSNAAPLHDLVRGQYSKNVVLPRIPDRVREDILVPTTAIFSRTDGIVSWTDCIDIPGDRHENVEVYGSHCGLGHNPSVLAVVADRLAQSPAQWRPFAAARAFAHLYPDVTALSAA